MSLRTAYNMVCTSEHWGSHSQASSSVYRCQCNRKVSTNHIRNYFTISKFLYLWKGRLHTLIALTNLARSHFSLSSQPQDTIKNVCNTTTAAPLLLILKLNSDSSGKPYLLLMQIKLPDITTVKIMLQLAYLYILEVFLKIVLS